MLVVLPFHAGDVSAAQRLAAWVVKLGPLPGHHLLLVHDPGVAPEKVRSVESTLRPAFAETRVITLPGTVSGFPDGANAMFRFASKYVQGNWPQPFLWLEPDATPLCAEWLEIIAREYAEHRPRYMGHIYANEDPRYPKLLMSGVAVYPADAWQQLFVTPSSPLAWDVDFAHIMVGEGRNTPRIRHFWGEPGRPPVFAREPVPDTNIFALSTIPEGCVLWHRCKDDSLITRLREKLFGERDEQELLIVLPFCNVDSDRMLKTAQWMAELHPGGRFDCLLSYQQQTDREMVRQVRAAAARAFRRVMETTYASPPPGSAAQTWAWRHVALHVADRYRRPWLWNEADMVPLKPAWAETLEAVYQKKGRPFAGPKVKGMGHANGTCIYAPDTPHYLPRAIRMTNCIWDVNCAPEMMPHFADIGDVLFHAWGVHDGRLHSYIGGAPDFSDDRLYAQIPASAVTLHRSKDGRLIDRLRRSPR